MKITVSGKVCLFGKTVSVSEGTRSRSYLSNGHTSSSGPKFLTELRLLLIFDLSSGSRQNAQFRRSGLQVTALLSLVSFAHQHTDHFLLVLLPCSGAGNRPPLQPTKLTLSTTILYISVNGISRPISLPWYSNRLTVRDIFGHSVVYFLPQQCCEVYLVSLTLSKPLWNVTNKYTEIVPLTLLAASILDSPILEILLLRTNKSCQKKDLCTRKSVKQRISKKLRANALLALGILKCQVVWRGDYATSKVEFVATVEEWTWSSGNLFCCLWRVVGRYAVVEGSHFGWLS